MPEKRPHQSSGCGHSHYRDDRHPSKRHKTPDNQPNAKFNTHADTRVDPTADLPSPLPPLPPLPPGPLAKAPFTHPSSVGNEGEAYKSCYEQYEFVGDAFIGYTCSRLIRARFPALTVGRMAQLRESIVCNANLAHYARAYGFWDRVVGSIEDGATLAQGGRKRGVETKILADCFEAYVDAIIEADPDNGERTAREWLALLWEPKLAKYSYARVGNDAKDELSKLLVSSGESRIEWRDEQPMVLVGKGRQKFFIECRFTGWGLQDVLLGRGEGPSKTEARSAAAADALVRSKDIIGEAHRKKAVYTEGRKMEAEMKAKTARE